MSRKSIRSSFIAFSSLIVAGCSSNQNLRDGDGLFGGGYQVTPVSNSIFYIYTRTNAAALPQYETAKTMFIERARQACASNEVAPYKIKAHLGDSNFAPFFVTETYGYAICLKAGLSQEAIDMTIGQYEKGR